MKLIIGGESGLAWLERATYHGAIGIFYNSTWAGVLTYLIVGVILVFAVMGFVGFVKNICTGKKKKKSQYKYFKD